MDYMMMVNPECCSLFKTLRQKDFRKQFQTVRHEELCNKESVWSWKSRLFIAVIRARWDVLKCCRDRNKVTEFYTQIITDPSWLMLSTWYNSIRRMNSRNCVLFFLYWMNNVWCFVSVCYNQHKTWRMSDLSLSVEGVASVYQSQCRRRGLHVSVSVGGMASVCQS